MSRLIDSRISIYEALENIKNGKYYYNIYDGDIVDWDNIKTT